MLESKLLREGDICQSVCLWGIIDIGLHQLSNKNRCLMCVSPKNVWTSVWSDRAWNMIWTFYICCFKLKGKFRSASDLELLRGGSVTAGRSRVSSKICVCMCVCQVSIWGVTGLTSAFNAICAVLLQMSLKIQPFKSRRRRVSISLTEESDFISDWITHS